VTSPARLRRSEVLAAQIAAVSPTTKTTSSEFVRGARVALHWLIDGGRGPLTAKAAHKPVTHKPVTVRALVMSWLPPRPSSTGASATSARTPRASNMP
jgi:hypothetical protein